MQSDNFTVSVQIHGKIDTVRVEVKPSTDDIDSYVCYVEDEKISQVRKDGNEWKQLWGQLDTPEINELGAQIENKLAS